MAPLDRLLRRVPLVAALLTLSAGIGWAQVASEFQVKAAYLYGFGRFTEWPASARANTGDSFVICLIGSDPFGRALDEVATNATMKDRPVRLQPITTTDEVDGCHTLFISASEDVRLAKILDAVASLPVLTVSDTPDFAQRGGIVGLFVDGKRVRFAVNLEAAQKSALTLNSELLRVSSSVIRPRKSRP